MFKFFARTTSCSAMSKKLADHSPDSNLWPVVSAYLIKGKRPESPEARAVIRAYLDLREHLGPKAAFANGAPLEHKAISGAAGEFFACYSCAGRAEPPRLDEWACFCLAADHLLMMAHAAGQAVKGSRRAEAERLEKTFCRVEQDFLAHLTAREAAGKAKSRGKAAPRQAPEAASREANMAAVAA